MSMDEIVRQQSAKLDRLLIGTKSRLECVEGPKCNRHHPAFNATGHPYYLGIELGAPMPLMKVLFG
jgi:hypothetical protein